METNRVTPKGNYADYLSGNYSDKEFIFELTEKNNGAYTTTGHPTGMRDKQTNQVVPFPLSKPIPMIGTVFFTEKGKTYPRRIRYLENESTIYADEQTAPLTGDNQPKKVVANFVKGRFRVDGRNSTLVKFMFEWDMNETKGSRDLKKTPMFRLVDNSKIAKVAQEKDELEFNVVKWCREADWDKNILPLCTMIFNPEHLVQSPSEIRYQLVQVAKRDPAQFQKMLDDPKTIRTITVKAAIEKGVITIDTSINGLFWTDNASIPLNVAAQGKDVIADFVAKSFSSDGERTYNGIYKLVNPEPELVAETQQTRVVQPPILKASTETDEELLTLIRTGVEKGLITVNSKKVWWKYKDENVKGEEGMIVKLRDNGIMLKVLKKEVLGE